MTAVTFVDIVVAAVSEARKDEYVAYARRCWELFHEYGAISMQENWGTDVPDGKLTSLPMAVKLEPGEAVVLSWITWPDKATRDACFAAFETDDRLAALSGMPYDGKRMIFGGFTPVLVC